MKKTVLKTIRRQRRKRGIRKRVLGSPDRPRLTVFRSLRHIYAQVIDDLGGRTIVSASTVDGSSELGAGNVAGAAAVGKALAEKAKSAGILRVVFDRNGYRFHGRVKALADAAREAGLSF